MTEATVRVGRATSRIRQGLFGQLVRPYGEGSERATGNLLGDFDEYLANGTHV